MKQKTIKNPVTLSGIGLHTGKTVHVTIKPAGENEGISFIRVDLPGKQPVKVTAANVVMDEKVQRCTAVEYQGVRIFTIEHLLAVLNGLGIDNVGVEIDGEELPGLDGSSLEFLKALERSGVEEQKADKNIFAIQEPIIVANKTSTVVMVPGDQMNISYTLDHAHHPLLRSQFFSLSLDPLTFSKELAPSRTFCLESEVDEIKAHGLGKGANYQNTLVMSVQGPLENTLRFPNECARHKVLDIVGDLYLLGYPVKGAVYATKSGHALNRALVKKIEAQRQKYTFVSYPPAIPGAPGRVFNINEIMKILPHRYPFLLVDRVIESEPGKKGTGIKNVTINDGFFQGHFPQKAVMPGVLMIEAMAQTAGVVVLTGGAHNGKVALFMSVSDVKFRKVVNPGDQLLMEVEIIRDRERTAHVKGVARVDGEVACEAEMMFSYTDAHYLNS